VKLFREAGRPGRFRPASATFIRGAAGERGLLGKGEGRAVCQSWVFTPFPVAFLRGGRLGRSRGLEESVKLDVVQDGLVRLADAAEVLGILFRFVRPD
jgi:hypothetical protein